MILEAEAQEKRIGALETVHKTLLDQLNSFPAQVNAQVTAAATEIKQQVGQALEGQAARPVETRADKRSITGYKIITAQSKLGNDRK